MLIRLQWNHILIWYLFATQLKEKEIEVLEQTEKTLTEEEAKEFYSHKADEVSGTGGPWKEHKLLKSASGREKMGRLPHVLL